MYIIITIAGDPTSWWTKSDADTYPDAKTLATKLGQASANVPVLAPVEGNLLISKNASVAILEQLPGESWIPSGGRAPVATLYVEAGPTTDSSGYTLKVGTNLDDLEKTITAAMDESSTVTVEVSSVDGSGVAVLNGASLTFAVVCPPSGP